MAWPERWSTGNAIGSRLCWRGQVARTGQLLEGWSWLWACLRCSASASAWGSWSCSTAGWLCSCEWVAAMCSHGCRAAGSAPGERARGCERRRHGCASWPSPCYLVRAGTCSRHPTGHLWRGPRRPGTWLAWPAPAAGTGCAVRARGPGGTGGNLATPSVRAAGPMPLGTLVTSGKATAPAVLSLAVSATGPRRHGGIRHRRPGRRHAGAVGPGSPRHGRDGRAPCYLGSPRAFLSITARGQGRSSSRSLRTARPGLRLGFGRGQRPRRLGRRHGSWLRFRFGFWRGRRASRDRQVRGPADERPAQWRLREVGWSACSRGRMGVWPTAWSLPQATWSGPPRAGTGGSG